MARLITLAAAAKAVDFEGVEERSETLHQHSAQTQPTRSQGAVVQGLSFAALHTDQVVVVALQRGVDGFPVGELAAAHGSRLLQKLESAIDGGQAAAGLLSLEALMQLLGAELAVCLLEQLKQTLLPVSGGDGTHRG